MNICCPIKNHNCFLCCTCNNSKIGCRYCLICISCINCINNTCKSCKDKR